MTEAQEIERAVYFSEMAKIDDVLTALARLEERITWICRTGAMVAVALAAWCGWLTNRVVATPTSLAAISLSPITEKTIKKTRELVTESLENPV